MSSPEVLTKNTIETNEPSMNGDYNDNDGIDEDEDFESTVGGGISDFGESSVAKLPGTALLKSVHNNNKQMAGISNHGSIKSLQSETTYDFNHNNNNNNPYDDSITEFGEDVPESPFASPKPKVPAWKLRQQALQSDVPPRKIVDSESPSKSRPPPKQPNNFRRSPIGKMRKTTTNNNNNNGSNETEGDKSSWLQRLVTKKETEEEKEKRLKSEALIQKQVSARWGKDILEEDSDGDDEEEEKEASGDGGNAGGEIEDGVDGSEKPTKEFRDEDESDTVQKVKSLIENSFGSALVSTIKKDKEKNAPDDSVFQKGGDENDDGDGDGDGDGDQKPQRGNNRWAMMGNAAMTSVRNLQRGMKRDAEERKKSKMMENPSETIAEEDENNSENQNEDGDKIPSEIETNNNNDNNNNNSRRSSMWKNKGATAFTSVRNAWGEAATRRRSLIKNDDNSEDLDAKSVLSEPGLLSRGEDESSNNNQNNLFSHIGNFLRHTRAKLDPECWADPEVQESLKEIERLKDKLQECRTHHRSETRRREKQIENSIMQQKTFLARKLHRQMFQYRKDPFHPSIKEVYEAEIRIIVHEATSLGGDLEKEFERDGIDDLLASSRFEYDYPLPEADDNATTKSGDGSIIDHFLSKIGGDDRSVDYLDDDGSTEQRPQNGRVINHDSIIPLETKLIRAQHNEWMTENQMELARSFQQKSVEHLCDLIPEIRKDHEKLKSISQKAMDTKIQEFEEYNAALKKAYAAHLEAQEKLLAIYRERYVPSVHEDEGNETENNGEKGEETNESDDDGENGDTFGSPVTTPIRARPTLWAKNIQQSVRGIFGPKKDETEDNKDEDNNGSVEAKNNEDDSGFSLSSPLSGGSLDTNKFLLSFGSPKGSAAASGILANFTAPSLTSTEDDANTDAKDSTKQSLQESAADSAAAAWKVPEPVDKGSLPETAAEKRAKRAAARRASRPGALSTSSDQKTSSSSNGISTMSSTASTSRSELLERARKARQESAAALDGQSINSVSSPTPSGRSGRSSRRSSARLSTVSASTVGSSNRKELSMRDLLVAAGDSRRKLQENDSRMKTLSEKNKEHSTDIDNSVSSIGKNSGSSLERRRRIARELERDDSLRLSSHHSLHERKIRSSSSRSTSSKKPWHEDQDGEIEDVDEFGQ